MRHIQQPEGSNMCGQAVVAMLGNMTIYEAIELVGTEGCTTTKVIAEALRALGFKCRNRLKRVSKFRALPKLCIVSVGFDGDNGSWGSHWIIWNGKEQLFYDPRHLYPVDEEFYYEVSGRITSYLEIKESETEEA